LGLDGGSIDVAESLGRPTRGAAVEPLPRELVHDEAPLGHEQGGDLVDRRLEIGDVVQREARHGGVEGRRGLELLQGHAAEDGAGGRVGIDRDDVVPRRREREGELTLTAADLEHAPRRITQRLEHPGVRRHAHR
jgi:hypothetical protein